MLFQLYTHKRETLRVGEYSRHDRDTSPINDQQWALESRADPCAFYDNIFVDP
jgi:hypothetical protein